MPGGQELDFKISVQCGFSLWDKTCQEEISEVIAINLLNLELRGIGVETMPIVQIMDQHISLLTILLSESIWYTMGTIGICPNGSYTYSHWISFEFLDALASLRSKLRLIE